MTPGQGQHDGNWTWHNLWNLSTINLKDESFHNSLSLTEYPTFVRENFQIYSAQVTGIL